MHGFAGLQEFRRKREIAISQIPDMKNGDWFHNGNNVLPIVLKTMKDLEKDFRKSDQVTEAILEKMVKNMLDVPEVRYTAKGLHVQARRILHRPSIIESPKVGSGPEESQPLPITVTVAASTPILGPDSGRLTQNPQTVSSPTEQTTTAAAVLPVVPAAEPVQNGSSGNLNLPIPNMLKNEHQSPAASASGSTQAASRPPGPSEQPLTPTVSNPRPSSTRRPSNKGPIRDLPNLEVDVVERWIENRKAGRPHELQGKYLLERLETRDHVGSYFVSIPSYYKH